jgi:hypothetical protein
MSDKNIVQSQCCECGSYGLCNADTKLCLDCDNNYNSEKVIDNRDNDHLMEKLLVDLKEFKEEKERLISLANKMIEEYQEKIEFYNSQIETKEKYTKDVIHSLVNVEKMKDTKTQKSYQLVSGKIIIHKESYSMKLCKDFNESDIPDRFIETKRSIKWGDYKKILKIINGNVINIQTGEIVKNVELIKNPTSLDLKLWGDK